MKILIIKVGALGDLIVAVPAIGKIISTHGSTDEVYLLTADSYAHLFLGWENLRVQAFPRKGIIATLKTLRWIRNQHFSRIYDLQSNDRSSILCALSGTRECVGNHPRFPYRYHPPDRYTGQCHVHERLNQILASAGVEPAADRPELLVSEDSRNKVAQWLAGKGIVDGRFVILHAGANIKHPHKRWPYYPDLARELHKRGLEILWTGGPDDYAINNNLARNIGHDISCLFSITEEIEMGRHARFAVTNDSAPMHILSCSGIPVYGIFGPTDWRRMHAVGQEDRVIVLDKGVANRENNFIPHNIRDISLSMVIDRLRGDGMLD